jgi:hypothetical protein
MNKLPLARSNNVVVQKMGKEILIYDMNTHKAYNLNETSTVIYNACDGVTSFDTLKSEHDFTDNLIFLALDELKKENLIEEDKSFSSPFAGISRREAIKKVGLSSMIALPLIASVIVPTAANAQSGVACTSTQFRSCNCSFPAGAEVTSSCVDNACPTGCSCIVNRFSCTDPADGDVFCSGTCDAVTA